MLHLHFAPSAGRLVPLLSEAIRETWKDPFASPAVMVPSPTIGKWLRMRLAAGENSADPGPGTAFGCVANLPMLTLERFLWDTLRPSPDMKMLSVNILHQVVCGLLDESLLEKEMYGPLQEYLAGPSGSAIDPVKRVQLSARVARQFLEYEYNRPSVWIEERRSWKPGIDATWQSGRDYREAAEHELWQKDLYCKAIECLRKAVPGSGIPDYISLPHLYRLRREGAAVAGTPWCAPPKTIHIFGVTKVSHFHRNTLVEISQVPGVEMRLFLTNPCAEFWEDVKTGRGAYRRKWTSSSKSADAGISPREPGDYAKTDLSQIAEVNDDNKLLEQWGGAGKENIFLWCPRAEWNFDYLTSPEIESDAVPKTLLESVQHSLLRRESVLKAPQSGLQNDGTLQVLACPDRGREVEELREQILDLVNKGKIKRLNEAVVYLPDPGAYVPSIQRVFGSIAPAGSDYIPFCILGAPGKDSLFAQGMRTLLELWMGSFDRARVFALLRNPLVQATRAIAPDEVAVWEGWAGELGIYRGYNRAHREEIGDKGEAVTDAHTFELGMARMLIGNLASGPVELDFTLSGSAGGRAVVPPFRDYRTSDPALLERFCTTVEQVHNDLQEMTVALAAGVPEAIETIAGIVWSWFGKVPDERAAEGRVLRDFLSSLREITLQKEIAGRRSIDKKEFVALVEGCLPAELPAGSSAWTGGITFAPLRPAMVVPARVIFVMGLDAAAFPGSSEKPSWDLLSGARIIGDSDPVRDNRFAFLELIHAARDRLVLSYRARDMQKEEDRQPSSVVMELEAFLKAQKISAPAKNSEDICMIHREVPWIVRESFDCLAVPERSHGTWDCAERDLARIANREERVEHRHDLSRPPASASVAAAPLRTSLYNVQKFFTNPLEYHLNKGLGIEIDEAPDTAGATDEPLDSGNQALSGLQKKIWIQLLYRVFPKDVKKAVMDEETLAKEAAFLAAAVYDEHIAGGHSPEAQFCVMEKQALVRWAGRCAAVTFGLKNTFVDHEVRENSDPALGRPGIPGELAVDIAENEKCVVSCRHRLVLIPRQGKKGRNEIALLAIKKEGSAADNSDLWLAGVIQWLAERAAAQTDLGIRLVALNRGDGKDKKTGVSVSSMKSECLKPNDIHQWFKTLLRLMLVDRCCDHLPFGVVQALYKDTWETVTADTIIDNLESEYSGYPCYLEAFDLTDARIPDISDSELQTRARERFAPLLEGWLHE